MKRKIPMSLIQRGLKRMPCFFLFFFLLIGHARLAAQNCNNSANLCYFNIETKDACPEMDNGQIKVILETSTVPSVELNIVLRIVGGAFFPSKTAFGGEEVVFDNLSSKMYKIKVTAVEGASTCECELTTTLSDAPEFSIAFLNVENISCPGEMDGSALASVSPPGNYTYDWSSGETNALATMLVEGNNTVTVRDVDSECEESNTLSITEPQPITFSNNPPVSVSCKGEQDGSVEIFNVNGGTGDYTYFVDGVMVAGTVFTGLGEGPHTIVVKDINDCMAMKVINISSPDEMEDNEEITNLDCNGDSSGRIRIEPTGGTNTFTYLWSNGATSKNINNISADTYTVTITDGKGCTLVSSFEVTEPEILMLDATVEANVSCTGLSLGIASAAITGGTTPYAIIWSTGSTMETVDQLDPGNYSVAVTDEKGCTDADEVNIFMEENPQMTGLTDATVSNAESITQNFGTENPLVTFHWEITASSNIDTADPDYNASGSIDADPGVFSQTYHLTDRAKPGTVDIAVFPQSGDCIGNTLKAQFIIEADDIPVYIPDLITPNGDGSNDSWKVVFPTGVDPATVNVVIYNRAGGKVYEGNMAAEWEAQNCPDGVYFYRLSSSASPDFIEEGAVSVLRRL